MPLISDRVNRKGVYIVLKVTSWNDLQRKVSLNMCSDIILVELDVGLDFTRRYYREKLLGQHKDWSIIRYVQLKEHLTTNVSSILQQAFDNYSQYNLNYLDASLRDRIQSVLVELDDYKCGAVSFTMKIDDLTGKSSVESFSDLIYDKNLNIYHYTRTKKQNRLLGLTEDNKIEEDESSFLMRQFKRRMGVREETDMGEDDGSTTETETTEND